MKETKFKQTEVGMIPSDWEETYLGNIGPVKMCKRVMKYQTSEKGDIPFYKIGTFGKSPDAYISKDLYHYLKNKYSFPQKGTVLISAAGTIGRTVVYDGKDAFFQDSNIVWLENDESVLTNQYLYYLYQVVEWKTENGGAVSRLYNDNFKITPIAIPSSKKEQQRIANALSDVDTLIANLEKLIAKKKNIKQGTMQQLLTGKKRLPGFGSDERQKECHSERSAKREVEESSGYKMTELGMIPNDWEFVPVSELAKDMADGPFGSNLKKEHYTSDPQARIIQLSNIGENGWEDENTKYTTFEHAKTIARCIVPKEESILVAKMMPAGRAIICPKKEKQYVLGSDVIRITANEKLNSKYFVYASKSDAYLKQISDNTQGSTRQRTSISKLRKILILLPSLAEQTAIANVLSDMDTEISALETKLAKYRTLKTGMMQQLLTGKIRLV